MIKALRQSRRKFWAQCEPLEPRQLLTNYSLSILSDLTDTVGNNTTTAPALDAQGDLFDITHPTTANGQSTVFELPAGQHTVQAVSVIPLGAPVPSSGNVVIDSSGDIFWAITLGSSGTILEIPHGGSLTTYFTIPSPLTNGASPYGELTFREPAVVLNGVPLGMAIDGMTNSGGLNSTGTIFEISNVSSLTDTVIVPFPADDPTPGTALTRDPAGDLFGTYLSGGPNDDGEIFEAPAGGGVLLTSASFDGANGVRPNGALLYDSKSGDFFGTTLLGGTKNLGVIYKFDGTNITALASFTGANGEDLEGSLYEDAAGNLFGTTNDGGANSDGTIFELPSGSSTIKTIVSFDGSNDGSNPTGGLVADGSGNLYGVTAFGGPFGDGVVYELSPLPASQLKFDSQPQSRLTDNTLAPMTVDVDDADDGIISSNISAISLSLLSGPIGAVVHGSLTENAVGGVATFSGLSFSTPGTYTFKASNGILTSAISAVFTISLPPTQLQFVSQPQTALTVQTLGSITVDVEDANGNIVTIDDSDVTLALTNPVTGAVLGGTSSVSAVNGVATFAGLSVNTGGTFTLTAADFALTPAVSNSFTIAFPPPHVAFTVSLPDVEAGVKLPSPVVIDLIGADGNVETTGKPTKVTITATDPKGKLLRFNAVSKKGVATFKAISFKTAGSYTLTASGGTFAADNSMAFVVTPAAAKKILFTMLPVSVAENTPFTVQVELLDQFANLAIDDDSTATISFVGKPKLAELAGTTAVSVANGLATFSNLSINVAAKGYMLKVIDGKLHATSKRFAVN